MDAAAVLGQILPAMPFSTFVFRGEKILARIDPSGAPLADAEGRVEILYKAGGKTYRAAARNLAPAPGGKVLTDAEAAPQGPAPEKADAKKAEAPAGAARANGARGRITDGAVGKSSAGEIDAIIAYTDGACSGNPGPMGVGVVLVDPISKERRERSEYLGEGTNNIAELVAIQRAIELSPPDRTLIVHSDSSYALGLLALGWKAKANQALVAELRALAAARPGLRLVKVAGHSGVPENERADELATSAVKRRATTDTHDSVRRPA